jgi:hypothetical protein
MVKKKTNTPDFKVPIPFILKKDKDQDPKDKSIVVKLTTNLTGEALPNRTNGLWPIFKQGTVEQYFKWISSFHNIMSNNIVRENYAVALKTMKGSDIGMQIAQCNANYPDLADHLQQKRRRKPCSSLQPTYY